MRGRRSFGLVAVTIAITTALWSPIVAAKDTTIDDFEPGGLPLAWTFSNGPEFPGAKGSLSEVPGHHGTGAQLAFDFTGGGAYVAATLTLAPPIDAAAIGFWAKAPAGIHVTLRVVDATSQTLQYDVTRPLGAFDASAWYRQVIALDASTGHWGGANDGVVHGKISALSILAANPSEPKMVGFVDFDEVVAVDALGQAIDLSTPTFAVPSGSGDLSSRLGVNIHFFKDDKGLDAAKGIGFSRVRMDLGWGGVEATKGVYDFSQIDALVDALATRGMTLHLILDYTNPLYPLTSDPAFVGATVPAFAAMSKAAATHFKGKNVTYEVWNEANGKGFWPPTPDPSAYAALCKATVAAVHDGDASAKVSTTGTAGFDFAFDRAMIAAGGAIGADAIGVHPYRASSPETLTDDLLLLRAIADALPGKPPTWDTEWGYSSTWFGDGHDPAARAMQARMVVRELLSAWAVGFPLVVDYDLRDDGTDPTNAEHNFGLLQNDYTDKPSAVAVRTLSKASAGRTFAGTLDLEPTTLHAMRLDGATDVTLVVWAERGAVPVTMPKTAKGIDMNGATIDLSSGAFTANADDGPRYVTIEKPSAPDAGPDADATDANGDDAARDAAGTNDASDDAGSGGDEGSSSGCGCAVVGDRSTAPFGAIALVALAALCARGKAARSVTRRR